MTNFSKILLLFLFVFSIIAQDKKELDLKLTSQPLPFGLSELKSSYNPEVYLSLSGGGARAVSQLGVLRAIQEAGIEVDGIIGTSMGSIIGGLYSAGYSLRQIDSLMINAPWDNFFTIEETSRKELFPEQKITEDKAIFALRLDGFEPIIPTAINTGHRVSNFLNLLALNAPLNTVVQFQDLRYNFKAVSTNLVTGEPYVLEEGSLSLAMRASSSVSLVLEPVKIDSLILVDGGLIGNNPVNTAIASGAEYVVAVDATSPLRTYDEMKYPWEVADQIVSIPMRLISEDQLMNADFVIKANAEGRKNTDFENLGELIQKNYESAKNVTGLLEKEIENLYLSNIEGEEKIYNELKVVSNDQLLEDYLITKFENITELTERRIIYEISNYDQLNNFSNVTAEIENREGGTLLRVTAYQNETIKDIMISGASLVDADSILSTALDLKDRPFNGPLIMESLLSILREYRANNYSLVRIESVSFENNILNIIIDEQKIDEIVINGNERTSSEVIKRDLPFEVGENFVRSEIEQGLSNLRSTNLFESVEIRIEQNNDKNILEVHVKEKPSLMLRMGLRIDTEYLTQISLDLRDENFLGTGTEIGAIFSGGIRNQYFSLEHRANRIFDTYLTYRINTFYNSRDINTYMNEPTSSESRFVRTKSGEYQQLHYGGSIGIGSQFQKFGNVMVEGRYQRDKIIALDDFPEESEFAESIAALRFILSIDSQNKYPFPTEGIAFNGYYETAQSAFGGSISYSKLSMRYQNYIPLNDVHNINMRIQFGYADETLPLTQQFSFGGQSSFFGYRDHSFRGRQIFISSVEYRAKMPFKIFFDTYLKARYDLGSIWNKQEQIRFEDLRHGIGGTLALDTPIGPAEFSVGKSFLLMNTLPENIISWGETLLYFTIGYYY